MKYKFLVPADLADLADFVFSFIYEICKNYNQIENLPNLREKNYWHRLKKISVNLCNLWLKFNRKGKNAKSAKLKLNFADFAKS